MILVSRFLNFPQLAAERLSLYGIKAKDIKRAPFHDHVTPEMVKDRIVIGSIPLFLASKAAYVIEIPIQLPAGFRVNNASIELLRQYSKKPTVYHTHVITDYSMKVTVEKNISGILEL